MSRNKQLAAIINAIISALGIVLSAVPLIRWGDDLPSDQPPYVVLLAGLVLGVGGLVGSYGIWTGKLWGAILTIVIRTIDGLLSIPGLFLAETTWLFVWALVSVIGAFVVILLLVKRDSGLPSTTTT